MNTASDLAAWGPFLPGKGRIEGIQDLWYQDIGGKTKKSPLEKGLTLTKRKVSKRGQL